MNLFNITKASSRSLLLFLLMAWVVSLPGAETARADDVDYIISMSKACRQIRREVFDIVKAAVEQTSKYGSAEEVSSAILKKNRSKLQEIANRYIQETPYLDVVAFLAVGQALVVVMHRDGQHPLGVLLSDHVLVEVFLDISRPRRLFDGRSRAADLPAVLLDDIVAQLHAFRTDKDVVRAFDQRIGLAAGAAAETANSLGFPVRWLFGHPYSLVLNAVAYL